MRDQYDDKIAVIENKKVVDEEDIQQSSEKNVWCKKLTTASNQIWKVSHNFFGRDDDSFFVQMCS